MSKEFFVGRDLYRTIKNMDRSELSTLLRKVYIMGQEDAIKNLEENKINIEKIHAEISEIKGIGEMRSKQIMDIISKNI